MAPSLTRGLELGQGIPLALYGTAWKGEKTAELTTTALKNGFRGVDTANHPTGYNEPLVGEGIETAIASGIKREDIFVRNTPFYEVVSITTRSGQD
jgi:diketogulonate reductase-like aldo/keto reductase